jgi:hypothetical protein
MENSCCPLGQETARLARDIEDLLSDKRKEARGYWEETDRSTISLYLALESFGERLAAPSGWLIHHSREPGLADPGPPSFGYPVKDSGWNGFPIGVGNDAIGRCAEKRAWHPFYKEGQSASVWRSEKAQRRIRGFGRGLCSVGEGIAPLISVEPGIRESIKNAEDSCFCG